MKSRSIFPGVSLVVMVLGLAFAVHEWKLAMEMSVQTTPLRPSQRTSYRHSLAPSNTLDVPRTPSIAAPRAVVPVSNLPSRQLKGANEALRNGIATNPEFTASYLQAYRTAVRQYYWGYLKKLGASESQMREFTYIMTKWRERWVDIQAAANAEGIAITSAEVEAMNRENIEERDAALRALLGPTAPERLKDYRNTLTERDLVADVAASAFSTGEPLTHEQSGRLVQLITDTKIGVRREGNVLIIPSDSEYDYFFHRAFSILTPNQVEVLRDTMARQRQGADRLRAYLPAAN